MWSRTRKFILFSFLFLTVTVGMVDLRGKYKKPATFLSEIPVVEGEAVGDQKRVVGTTDGGENEDLERRGDDADEGEYDAYDGEHGDADEGALGGKDEENTAKQTAQTQEGYEGQEEPKHFEAEKKSGKNGDEKEATGEGLLERFRRRRERVRAVCEQRRNNTGEKENVEVTLRSQILYFWGWNVSVCTIPKVGSGTWRGHVNRINGRSGDPLRDPKRRNLTRRSVRDVLGQVRETVRIMTVRHPLTRLVSAYRNKFRDGRRFGVHHKEQESPVLRRFPHARCEIPQGRARQLTLADLFVLVLAMPFRLRLHHEAGNTDGGSASRVRGRGPPRGPGQASQPHQERREQGCLRPCILQSSSFEVEETNI
ncbi:uncharacterized protein LOC119590034 isoform X2 [Penaeus monodon]|uniref:uncharacterized protein LOC119590034 isoform X2 n=1 Tax=Penaeus monodon TaxID=6687 RepID=UPI0018A6E028|nr:uncharacterized protein LOC119590034 isoform X2 [Penaeus monodon]